MPRTVLVVPTGHGVGLTSVCLGLVRALDRHGVPVGFVKPFAQPRPGDEGPERSTALIRLVTSLTPPEPMPLAVLDAALAESRVDALMERVVAAVEAEAGDHEVVVVEGLVPGPDQVYSQRVNLAMAKALDAGVVLVGAARPDSCDSAGQLAADMAIVAATYHAGEDVRVVGTVVNQLPAGADPGSCAAALAAKQLQLVAAVPERPELGWMRTLDLVRALGTEVLNEGELATRRIREVAVCAQSVPGMLSVLEEGRLIITPGDRHDAIMATCLAALGGTRLAGLLLSAGVQPDPQVWSLVQAARHTGLPILLSPDPTYETATRVFHLNTEVATDDAERAEAVMSAVADELDPQWLDSLGHSASRHRLSPAAFRYRITELARAADARIVLPEGTEPRTLQAAAVCAQRAIARCVLLGKPDEVRDRARAAGVTLPESIEILDPEQVSERYVAPMVALRAHKGLTAGMAREQLADSVVLGTMMLATGDVDGLVAGAINTTAHTIRPALQLIRTQPGISLVSSVFFMCLPDEVVVYGDCAVNPDPTADQLAEIALSSAASAEAFGIEPRVAMLSYSTGTSGAGSDVEKVAKATELARERRPGLAIDGPLQYDAAAIASVARSKRPGSPVAGRATVFVFPDLNTGNTTYKAVQRGADVVSIGPMLQGLAKPVNDLSRGALVEDIVYTIALTAVQAGAARSR